MIGSGQLRGPLRLRVNLPGTIKPVEKPADERSSSSSEEEEGEHADPSGDGDADGAQPVGSTTSSLARRAAGLEIEGAEPFSSSDDTANPPEDPDKVISWLETKLPPAVLAALSRRLGASAPRPEHPAAKDMPKAFQGLPRFSGAPDQDVGRQIRQFQNAARAAEVAEHRAVGFFGVLTEGPAFDRFHMLVADNGVMAKEEDMTFENLRIHFAPHFTQKVMGRDALEAWLRCRQQDRTVQAYIQDFDALWATARAELNPQLLPTESEVVRRFVSNMNKETRSLVVPPPTGEPGTLQGMWAAMAPLKDYVLARAQDAEALRRSAAGTAAAAQQRKRKHDERNDNASKRGGGSGSGPARPRAVGTPVPAGERAAYRDKGLCYHCHKHGHIAANCPDKNKNAGGASGSGDAGAR